MPSGPSSGGHRSAAAPFALEKVGRAFQREGTGGDFCLLLPGPQEDETVILLGDVCGHGAESALLAASLQERLRREPPAGAAEALNRLNGILHQPDHSLSSAESLRSLAACALDFSARGREAHVHVCGTPSPLLLRLDGRFEVVTSTHCPLGWLPEVSAGANGWPCTAAHGCICSPTASRNRPSASASIRWPSSSPCTAAVRANARLSSKAVATISSPCACA